MKATILWLMILVAAVTGYLFFKMIGWREREQARRLPQHAQVDYAKLAKERNLDPSEFVLTDQNGQLFTSDELRGKVWVLSFFFQNCAKECVELNRKLAELQQEIKDPDLHFVSVSCNPEIDTPSNLQRYQQGFHGDPLRWHMLTGNFDYIEKHIAKPAMLTYERSDHSRFIVIMGRDGKRQEYISVMAVPGEEPDKGMKRAKEKIKQLLAEPAPDAKKEAEQKPAEVKPSEQPETTEVNSKQVPAPEANKQTRRSAPARQLAEVAR